MPPRAASKKATNASTTHAKRPKSSVSKTISPTILPGRPIPKPRKTMNSASSYFDSTSSDDDPPFRPEHEFLGNVEDRSDSVMREEEEEAAEGTDGDLSETHEAFYPFPLPQEQEDPPTNPMASKIHQVNLEPPSPAKDFSSNSNQENLNGKSKRNVDPISPPTPPSSDEVTKVDSNESESVATDPSQRNDDAASTNLVPKVKIEEDPDAALAKATEFTDATDSQRSESLSAQSAFNAGVPPPSTSRAEPMDRAPAPNAPSSSSDLHMDSIPVSIKEEESDLIVDPKSQNNFKEPSASQNKNVEPSHTDGDAIKDEMLQSLLSAIGKSKETQTSDYRSPAAEQKPMEDRSIPARREASPEAEEMDPDFWDVEKRPSQRKMEEYRRKNALRDWDKECVEMLGFERAEKERRQSEWQNQKSTRVRAGEMEELRRERGRIDYRNDDLFVGGMRQSERDRRVDKERKSDWFRSGRGGNGRNGFKFKDPRGFFSNRVDSPPRFPYSSNIAIPPPSARYPASDTIWTVIGGVDRSNHASSTEDVQSKLAALQAQISARPHLFASLLSQAGVSAPAPPPTFPTSIRTSNPYTGDHRDPYGDTSQNHSETNPSLSSPNPYSRIQDVRERDYNDRFNSQHPYSRARSPLNTYRNHSSNPTDPYDSWAGGQTAVTATATDPYSRAYSTNNQNPPHLNSEIPSPQVTGYGSRSTAFTSTYAPNYERPSASGYGHSRYDDERDRDHARSYYRDPYRDDRSGGGGSSSSSGRGGKGARESGTKGMLS